MRTSRRVWIWIAILGLAGCNLVLDFDGKKCQTDEDCDSGHICDPQAGKCVDIAGCSGVDCSGHGTCDDTSGDPVCVCGEGYHAEGSASDGAAASTTTPATCARPIATAAPRRPATTASAFAVPGEFCSPEHPNRGTVITKLLLTTGSRRAFVRTSGIQEPGKQGQ